MCNRKENEKEIMNCWLNSERENFNWEKHQMMLDFKGGISAITRTSLG